MKHLRHSPKTDHQRGSTRQQDRGARETRPEKIPAVKIARTPDGKFLKGVSANPRGRAAPDIELRTAARTFTLEAIETLARWMRSPDPIASVRAACELLNRGHGKPEGTATPLVSITMGQGGAIIDAASAARAYAEIVGRPDADLAALTFGTEVSK
jgi:hypothetical protein